MVQLRPNDFLGNPFETRDDVLKGCKALLDPLEAHTSPGGALINLSFTATHYDLTAVALEAFARPLWGLTSLLLGGDTYDGLDRWVRGLANGTDPDEPEYWGGAKAKDQRMVEMSPLSFAIAMAPEKFYEPQSDEAKTDIAAFLETCIGKPMPDTNWLWFRVFANLALRSIKSPLFNPTQMDRDLARLEEFQFQDHPPTGNSVGSGGWSNDRPDDVFQRDYYSSSFAIQFAQMTYSRLCAESDPERAQRFRKRAQDVVLDFIYYINDEGDAIPFGRSMVYRFIVTATFSGLVLADVPPPAPLEWGHIKGLFLRHMKTWASNKEIFRSDGTLTISYGYDTMNMTENYNAPGSPYWCMKAFGCLAAPATHPFWTSTELPWPKDLFPPIKALPDPYHIMTRLGGHTPMLSSGQKSHYNMRHGVSKYGKDLPKNPVIGDNTPILRHEEDSSEGKDDEKEGASKVKGKGRGKKARKAEINLTKLSVEAQQFVSILDIPCEKRARRRLQPLIDHRRQRHDVHSMALAIVSDWNVLKHNSERTAITWNEENISGSYLNNTDSNDTQRVYYVLALRYVMLLFDLPQLMGIPTKNGEAAYPYRLSHVYPTAPNMKWYNGKERCTRCRKPNTRKSSKDLLDLECFHTEGRACGPCVAAGRQNECNLNFTGNQQNVSVMKQSSAKSLCRDIGELLRETKGLAEIVEGSFAGTAGTFMTRRSKEIMGRLEASVKLIGELDGHVEDAPDLHSSPSG